MEYINLIESGVIMKICTYNIWNHDRNYKERMNLLIQLLNDKTIDILLLQEVRDKEIVLKIQRECNFEYYHWKEYFDCKEGLAIVSRYEMSSLWTNWDSDEDVHNSASMCVNLEVDGKKLSIMNVHLDYKYSFNRELELIKALNHLQNQSAELKIIAGDFNTYPESKIYRFLTGLESISERSERWIDLAEAFCIRNDRKIECTIDFVNNPRWLEEPCLERPGRFDWIMLKNPYPKAYPRVLNYELLGNKVVNSITASDHYGVLLEVEIS